MFVYFLFDYLYIRCGMIDEVAFGILYDKLKVGL